MEDELFQASLNRVALHNWTHSLESSVKNKIQKELEERIEETGAALDQLSQKFENLLITSEKLINEVNVDQGREKLIPYPGLNFITLRNAMCSRYSIDEQIWRPKFLATSGNGPWAEKEFDDF